MNDELEVRKFPAMGGYDVTIVNKNDILKTIDDNIIDKEIAYEIITSLELSCQKYVSAGDTAGIPYIGKIKERLTAAIARENKEALNDAREVLDKEHYIAFNMLCLLTKVNVINITKYINLKLLVLLVIIEDNIGTMLIQ